MARTTSTALGGMPRVNLLPRSELDRREREKLSASWVRIVLLVILLAAVLVGAAYVWNQFEQQKLAAEQSRTDGLLAEISGLSDVSKAQQLERELIAFRTDAMGSDLAWAAVLNKVESALPGDTSLVGFDLTPGAAPDATAGADAEARATAAKSAVGLTGTITVDSPTALEMAPLVRALRGVEGIADADANATTGSSVSNDRFTYTIDITFSQTVYSGQYEKEAEK